MKDFFILKVIDKFKFIYEKMGVDYKQVRLILQSKLTMDARKNTKDDDTEKNTFYSSLIVYSILGLFSAFILRLNIDVFVRTTIYFAFIMSVIFMAFISEFSSVLLDIKDKNILATKGIDYRTLNIAKITHILIYIVLLSLSISGFGIIVAISYGVKFLLLFLISILFVDLFMIVLTSLLYSVIIKIFNGEKLKDMINILQIGVSILFIVIYQVIGRAVNIFDMNIVYESKIWNIFIPPMWFASNFRLIFTNNIDAISVILSILSVVVPVLCFIVYIKNVYKFENNLNKLNDNTYKKSTKYIPMTLKISKLICSKKEERAYFNFTCNILSKDRELKMRTYPSLALSIVFPYIMIFSMYKDISPEVACITIYTGIIMMIGYLSIIKYSNNYKASWIYSVAPLKETSSIFKGMIKSIIYKIYLPIFLILSIGYIFIFKIIVIKHLIVVFLGLILITILIVRIENTLPFSINYSMGAMSSNIGKLFVYMLLIGIIALIHYLVSSNVLFTYLYIIILLVVINMLWNKLLNIKV